MGVRLRECLLQIVVLLLSLAAGCSSGGSEGGPTDEVGDERTTIRVQRAGGQTGMEGSCWDPEVDALDFAIDDVRALVEGNHETTLAYRPLLQTLDADLDTEAGRDMTVRVRFIGEPQTVLDCGGSLRQDVEVTLSFDEPPLDVIFEETLFAFTAELALVQVELDPDVAESLALQGAAAVDESFTLTIGFTPDGPRGTMGMGGGNHCGVAVLPSGLRCEEPFQPEVDLDEPVRGVRSSDALEALATLGALPVQWDDGTSTTLSVAVEGQPSHACGDWTAVIGSLSPAQMRIPLRVHITTDDGRVDLRLPAEFGWSIISLESVQQGAFESAGWDGGWGLQARALFPQSALNGGDALLDVTLPDDRAISVAVRISMTPGEGAQSELEIDAVGPDPDAEALAGPIDMTTFGKHILCFGGEPQPIAAARNPDSVR